MGRGLVGSRPWQKVKTKGQSSFLAIFFKNLDLGEYIARYTEKEAGGTREPIFKNFYEEVKKGSPGMEDSSSAGDESKEVEDTLAVVDRDFDAAPDEVKIVLKAQVYKHFDRDKQALETAFNYYETILKSEGKQNERALLEDFVIDEVLPIVVTYEVEEHSMVYRQGIRRRVRGFRSVCLQF